MNFLRNEIILSHSKIFRFFTAILFVVVILGCILSFLQFFSSDKKPSLMDILGIISGISLTMWNGFLICDSWKIIKVNEKMIEKKVFFYSCFIHWNDITGIKEKKTNQFKNFVQGKILVLVTKQGKEIDIAEKYNNFSIFYNVYIKNMFHDYTQIRNQTSGYL